MKLLAAGLLILGILSSSAASAAMDKEARGKFTASCETQMYMSGAQCACMADIADRSLDEVAVAYLSLAATDVVHSAALAKSMTAAERSSIDHFMQTAPKACKGAK